MVALAQKRKADGKQRQDSKVERECEDHEEEQQEGLELTEEMQRE